MRKMSLPATLHPRSRERLSAWAADPEVVGALWVGSRSRGLGDAGSDDDLEIYLFPEALARVAPADTYVMELDPEAQPPRLFYDAQLCSLEGLRAKASSPRDLDHWPYERAQLLLDRDGSLEAALLAAAAMPAAFRRSRIQHAALDAVLACTRAPKTQARGFPAATQLLLARGVKALCRVLFALEGRWVPLDHWLEPELASLADPEGVGPLLLEALRLHSASPLQEALRRLEACLEAEGFPRPAGRSDFYAELMHPSRAEERALHFLP